MKNLNTPTLRLQILRKAQNDRAKGKRKIVLGQAGGEQGNYLSQFGSKDVQNGICLNLAIAMLYFYKANPIAPNLIWQEMKDPTKIKQIANNQQGYKKLEFSVNDCLNLYRLINQELVEFTSSEEIAAYAQVTLNHTPMNLVIIYLQKGKDKAGHAISLIRHNATGRVYMYDPNIGVMSVPVANQNELINLIKTIYEIEWKYKIYAGEIIEVV